MVGAGAAGLVASIFAAEGPRPVVVIERTADGGRKILISGGGRCNILPSVATPERFVTDSPTHLMRGMLRAWSIESQRAFFEQTIGLPLALEAESGKLFPRSNRARDVRDGLVAHARRRGVELRFGTSVTALRREAQGWALDTTGGTVAASRVILASGGLSVPQTGSDGAGLRIAADLGHAVHDTYPALTPLTTDAGRSGSPTSLSGLSLDVRLRGRWNDRTVETSGGFLFTHRGFSGPAVLDISHLAVRSDVPGDPKIRVGWSLLSAEEWDGRLKAADVMVAGVISRVLPNRLAEFLMTDADVPVDRRTSSLRRPERTALVERLTAYVLPWVGDEGYKKAEVTGGGVALDAVHLRTLESRLHPGLYLCGEMLDAFGPIGGHNFAWAWSTGRTAGMAAAVATG